MQTDEPRRIHEVYRQILKHPKYCNLSEGTRYAIQIARHGYSYKVKVNNKSAITYE